MINVTFWQYSAWAIAIALSFVIVYELRQSEPDISALKASPSYREFGLALALIAIGVVLRFAFLDEFQAGRLTSDENRLAVIYTSTIAHGEVARGGATQLAFAQALDFWYRIIGFTPLKARVFSATLGLVSLIFFFFGLKQVAGQRLALWSTAFYSISLFGIYFSKLAIETGWVLFIPPIVFFFFVMSRHNRYIFSSVSGFVFSLGIFSYPGLLLAVCSLVAGTVIVFFIRGRAEFNRNLSFNRQLWMLALAFLAGAIPFTTYALYEHSTVYGGGQQLMTGNGVFTFALSPLLAGLGQVLKDSFINADSWYMPYKNTPFFEVTLLPLAVFGLYMFWRAKWPWYAYGFFISVPFCIALVPFAGPYPGMRRALFSLLPYCVAVGGGWIYFVSALTKSQKNSTIRLRFLNLPYRPLALGILFFSIFQPVAYQFTTGRDDTRWNFGEGFAKPPIPYDLILSTLKTNDIVLDRDEFAGYFDDLIYVHYPRLYGRYNSDAGISHHVSIMPTRAILQSEEGSRNLDNKIMMTWDERFFRQLVASGKVCITPELMSANKANSPYLGLVSHNCANSIQLTSTAGSEMSMVFDRFTRLKHQLHCDSQNCGADRPNFINTNGGYASFILSPKSHDKTSVLRLKVVNPAPDRESLIFVNDNYIGTLSSAILNNSGEFAEFIVPAQAATSSENWQIRIGPSAENPGKPGWDIVDAALLVVDEASTIATNQILDEKKRVHDYKELGTVRQPGTAWDDKTIILDKNGITVNLGKPMTANLLDISFDNNDDYSVLFFNNKTLITSINIVGIRQGYGLEKRTLTLPRTLGEKAFNNVQIIPVSGDGNYAVGHFILK